MIDFKNLLNIMSNYTNRQKKFVKKAYDFSYKLHSGQVRESGESYITIH